MSSVPARSIVAEIGKQEELNVRRALNLKLLMLVVVVVVVGESAGDYGDNGNADGGYGDTHN